MILYLKVIKRQQLIDKVIKERITKDQRYQLLLVKYLIMIQTLQAFSFQNVQGNKRLIRMEKKSYHHIQKRLVKNIIYKTNQFIQDFPDPDLLPAKELIASLPSHVDRPPAEKFDSIILNLYKEIQKHLGRFKSRQQTQQEEELKETLRQDQQYVELFGVQNLQIQRGPSRTQKQNEKKVEAKMRDSIMSRANQNSSQMNKSDVPKENQGPETRKFMISLERTDMKVKQTYDGGSENQRVPVLFTKFNKLHQKDEPLLPIPLGFFNARKPYMTGDHKSRTMSGAFHSRLSSAPFIQQVQQRIKTHQNQRPSQINHMNSTISPIDSPRSKHNIFDQTLTILRNSQVNQSLEQPTGPTDRMSDFLNKKKIPGILDYLESKIYERSKQSYISIINSGQQIGQYPYKQASNRLFSAQEDMPQEMALAQNYYSLEFEDGKIGKKQPLVDHRKRKLLSNLLKNENFVMKSIHNSMIERIIHGGQTLKKRV
ncbi:UNKNOWN [Stylonychia lemnae]|uniref:Uncharacterized protein n=1 Tax=Stylonychia lemnae TaxID=5949 RepID=A0A077ZZQ5_STYLE|nr:UNKNOWN [Stylonychia lemnae]|eukprot:CDW75102.1 UNKNOWN [Stylonychia lemnae]